MYSILILDTSVSKWDFAKDDTDSVWTGTLAEAKSKYISLLKSYTTQVLKVVHNTTVDLSDITIADVTE